MQQELREAFRLYDKEGNGYITTAVFRDILHELDDKLSPEELDLMIEEIDADGSGTLDFDGIVIIYLFYFFAVCWLLISDIKKTNFWNLFFNSQLFLNKLKRVLQASLTQECYSHFSHVKTTLDENSRT